MSGQAGRVIELADWQRLFPGESAVGGDLLSRWSEPHRRYHTLSHLQAMLLVIDGHADLADDADAVRLAAWFHDAVYAPLTTDNEEQSALLALDALGRLGIAAARADEVARLVRLTAGHLTEPGDRNGALLTDADLAILAAEPSDYAQYAAAVRQEYAAVPDEVFRPGRAQILRNLLDLPSLYRILPDSDALTVRAHANLRAELQQLTTAPDAP